MKLKISYLNREKITLETAGWRRKTITNTGAVSTFCEKAGPLFNFARVQRNSIIIKVPKIGSDI